MRLNTSFIQHILKKMMDILKKDGYIKIGWIHVYFKRMHWIYNPMVILRENVSVSMITKMLV